jgi:O-antigen ligase
MAAFLAIFGFVKRFGTNPFPWWDYPELIQNTHRVSGTFGNANHLAGYMEMAIPLVLGLFLMGITGAKRFLLICLTCVLLTALLLTLSRGGWISAFFGLTFMALALMTNRYFERKRLIVAVCGGLFVAAFIVLASTPVVERILTMEEEEGAAGFSARAAVWGATVNIIQDYPLLGSGPGTFSTVFTQHQPAGYDRRYLMAHNDYLQFSSELGFLLVPIVVWMLIALYRRGFKKLQNPSRLVRGVTIGAMSAITAILIHSVVDFNLHIPSNAILCTVLAALVVSPIPTPHKPRAMPAP